MHFGDKLNIASLVFSMGGSSRHQKFCSPDSFVVFMILFVCFGNFDILRLIFPRLLEGRKIFSKSLFFGNFIILKTLRFSDMLN